MVNIISFTVTMQLFKLLVLLSSLNFARKPIMDKRKAGRRKLRGREGGREKSKERGREGNREK